MCIDQVVAADVVSQPITKLQCSPTSDGAGAAILCSEAFVNKQRRLNHNLATDTAQPVEVGAVWSDPSDPDGMGGKPVVAKGSAKNPELDAMRAGHFFVDVPPAAKQADALAALVALEFRAAVPPAAQTVESAAVALEGPGSIGGRRLAWRSIEPRSGKARLQVQRPRMHVS